MRALTRSFCAWEVVVPLVWSSAVRFAAYMPLEDVGTPAGIAILCEFIQRTNAEALLAFWDPEMLWLAANEDSLPRGCKLLMSSKEALQGVQSKHDQLQLAERCGFSVLPTWQLSRQEDASGIDPAAYPVCLRPSAPSGVKPTFKVEVLQSPSELNAFLGRRTWGPEPLLVQPFLPLPTVVIHGVRSESGELLALEAFIAPMKFQGITLELRPLRLDENIARCCRKFANEAGITGPFHFELLYSAETGSFYYLEINARLGGTTDKVFRLGFDEPLLTLSGLWLPGAGPPLSRPGRPAGDQSQVGIEAHGLSGAGTTHTGGLSGCRPVEPSTLVAARASVGQRLNRLHARSARDMVALQRRTETHASPTTTGSSLG